MRYNSGLIVLLFVTSFSSSFLARRAKVTQRGKGKRCVTSARPTGWEIQTLLEAVRGRTVRKVIEVEEVGGREGDWKLSHEYYFQSVSYKLYLARLARLPWAS